MPALDKAAQGTYLWWWVRGVSGKGLDVRCHPARIGITAGVTSDWVWCVESSHAASSCTALAVSLLPLPRSSPCMGDSAMHVESVSFTNTNVFLSQSGDAASKTTKPGLEAAQKPAPSTFMFGGVGRKFPVKVVLGQPCV